LFFLRRWYEAPAPSNFITVTSEDELRDVMVGCTSL
jgi:hypothetical protein